jgi:nitrogen-specific signal transduction histidine kinase
VLFCASSLGLKPNGLQPWVVYILPEFEPNRCANWLVCFHRRTGCGPRQKNATVQYRSNIRHYAVKDNGNGIPQKVIDKIFQPFFTTKPTGQGTGLGLSLSYDIVKAHGGEIKVETKEGVGSAFIIQLAIA